MTGQERQKRGICHGGIPRCAPRSCLVSTLHSHGNHPVAHSRCRATDPPMYEYMRYSQTRLICRQNTRCDELTRVTIYNGGNM